MQSGQSKSFQAGPSLSPVFIGGPVFTRCLPPWNATFSWLLYSLELSPGPPPLSLSLSRPSLSFPDSRSSPIILQSLSFPLFQSVSPSFHTDRSSLIGFTPFLIGPKVTLTFSISSAFTLFTLFFLFILFCILFCLSLSLCVSFLPSFLFLSLPFSSLFYIS